MIFREGQSPPISKLCSLRPARVVDGLPVDLSQTITSNLRRQIQLGIAVTKTVFIRVHRCPSVVERVLVLGSVSLVEVPAYDGGSTIAKHDFGRSGAGEAPTSPDGFKQPLAERGQPSIRETGLAFSGHGWPFILTQNCSCP